MLKLFSRFAALLRFAFERLWHHPGLTFLALLGVVLTVGLVTNASFFAEAIDQVMLDQELAQFSAMTGRPPFSTSVYTFPTGRAPISLEMAEQLAENVSSTLSAEVGLPLRHVGTQVHSGNMMLRPRAGTTQFGDEADLFLGSVDMAYIAGVTEHMNILLGEPLDADGASEGGIVDVWMHTRLAERMGINIGDELEYGTTMISRSTPFRVVGIWRAADLSDPFWFENPDATLQNVLLVRRQDYITYVQPLIASQSWYLSWHIILDDSHVIPARAQDYLEGFRRAEIVIDRYLPNARINTPPLDPLRSFVTRGDTLTILLLGFNLPALGFLLYFLVLSSAIIAQWQQRETATLVSRGIRAWNILTLTLVEQFILFLIGYPLGVALGMVLARTMGNTASFLSFTSRPPLPVTMRGLNVTLTLLALAVALLARVVPAMRATRLSAIEVDQERARPQRAPFWYRAYLDFILLIPTYYAYRQLLRHGSLAVLAQSSPEDLYQDPLLILVPALFILTVALMTLRLFPWVMRGLDLIANLIPWSTPHLALRQLARRSTTYINPLLLVITSLALGVYMLSMAASLDQWLIDRSYYNVGSDLAFNVLPNTTDDDALRSVVSGEWIPLPSSFRELPGVQTATRVGDYSMSTQLVETGRVNGRFLAVDRTEFAQTAWFRHDFAREPLGGLMNQLALYPDSILISEDLLRENLLQVGDQIVVRIGINYEFSVAKPFTIAGTYRYFPTVYEDDRITFIGNLDDLSLHIGMTVPHGIWMRLDDNVNGRDVINALPSQLNVRAGRIGDSRATIAAEQAKHERVGVFGTLTVGFVAAVIMATMGLLIYTYASLQERLHRFTILRAIGLLRSEISGQVIMEYVFLTAYGAIAGALAGSFASTLFVPMFRVTAETGVPLPPLIPIIAQDQVQLLVTVFVGLIVLLEVIVISRALSQRAFSMLKGVWG